MQTMIQPKSFFLVLLIAIGSCQSLMAQDKEKSKDKQKDKKNGTVHIRIEKEENGQKKVYERTYQDGELPDGKGEALLDLLPDSLQDEFYIQAWGNVPKGGRGWRNGFFYAQPRKDGKGRDHSFYFDDHDLDSLVENGQDWVKKLGMDGDFPSQHFEFHSPDFDLPMEPLQEWHLNDPALRSFNFSDVPFGKDKYEFSDKEYDVKELKTDQGKKYIITRKKRLDEEKSGVENASTSIRQLRIEPASSHGMFDLRFYAPIAGEALIAVTNTQGKEVLRERIKNVSGNIQQSLDLHKEPAGVYFVTVTQNNDGVTKRLVIR